ERECHTIRQKDGEITGEFIKRFLRLAGFVGKKVGPPEEQAKHFKWDLSEWILDGIVNTEFTDVAQVANARRNIELLCERGGVNNKRNRDGDRIQLVNKNNNQRGYGQRGNDGRNYDKQGVNALLAGLTAQITNELRQNGARSNCDQPPTIHTWSERFGKQKTRSFSSAISPVDAKNWIAHIEKLSKVLGCHNLGLTGRAWKL
nr:zinc finger, CCHC-type, retrotransposon Gag domain protein [Tanacetum cinerariifolium]